MDVPSHSFHFVNIGSRRVVSHVEIRVVTFENIMPYNVPFYVS